MSNTRTSAKMVIGFLGMFSMVGLVGVIWLISKDAKGELIAIVAGMTGTATGALAGLLSQTEKPGDQTQDVNVVNRPNEPIPVEEQP